MTRSRCDGTPRGRLVSERINCGLRKKGMGPAELCGTVGGKLRTASGHLETVATVRPIRNLQDDISGFLYPGKRPVIGVNKDQAQVRQRFTIAHELGHLKLHEHRQVHVDREFRVRFRSGTSSQGINRDEMEANRFAAELLMPLEFLRRDIEERDFALTDNEALWSLAKIYGVSAQAMAFRLNGLGIPIVEEE